MPLLGKNGVPFRIGNSLVSVPQTPGCLCCDRYACRTGGAACRECVIDPDGEYRTLEECEEFCPADTCIWCIEEPRTGPCGEEYVWHTCVETGCDESGECTRPSGVIVSGPLRVNADAAVSCFNDVCPDPPEPPQASECCDDGDCGCCRRCVDGYCVDCPPGTTCVNCECVPEDEVYYCCISEDDYSTLGPYGVPTGSGSESNTQCQLGPCSEGEVTVGGPYRDYTECCESCGCNYSCNESGYVCVPDSAGPYDGAGPCEEACAPEEEFGTCCYVIAPHTDDNEYFNPPAPDGCAIVKGCFGIMSYQECEALATDTGTTTQWHDEFLDCDLCPITASHVCCYPNPEDPCETLCHETDEGCCEEMGGKDYKGLRTCDERWPSGLSACRTELMCDWPAPRDEWIFGDPLQIREQYYSTAPRRVDDPPCIQDVQWKEGFPEALQDCYRWVRDFAKCETPGITHPVRKVCVRYRLMKLEGDAITDITATAVENPDGLECCECERNLNWAACDGSECEPLPFFPDPEANCPP